MTIPLASELYCLPPPVSIHHACLTLHVFAPVLNEFLPFVAEMINPDCLIIGAWRIHLHDLYVPLWVSLYLRLHTKIVHVLLHRARGKPRSRRAPPAASQSPGARGDGAL